MDVVAKRCEPCLAGMRCNWTPQSREESRRPPDIEPGFWAEPADVEHFVGYTLYRCSSASTCKGHSKCADGRMGRACGECKPGFWGSRDGSCTRCPVEPTQSRMFLSSMFLLSIFCFVATAKVLGGQGATRGIISKEVVSAVRTLKQAAQYFQLMAVSSGFAISWPSLLRGYVAVVSHAGFMVSSFGVGCLAHQQSLELVTIFECSLPVAMLFSAVLSSPCSRLMACILRCDVAFGVRQALVLFFMAFDLLAAAFIRSAFTLMVCRETPSGFWTVTRWPQLTCDEHRWRTLLPVACAAVVVYAILYLGFLAVAVASIARNRRASGGVERGHLGFAASNYRDTAYYWGLVLTTKNIFLIVSPGLFRSQVPLQLWMCSIALLAYALLVIKIMPWVGMYANFLDIALTLLLMCQLTCISGFGFVSGEGFDAMGEDLKATYHSREKWLLITCAAGLAFIAVQCSYRVSIAVPCIRRSLPGAFLPLSDDRRDRFNINLVENLALPPALSRIIDNMDEVEWHNFHRAVAGASSTEGVLARSLPSGHWLDMLEGADFQRISRRQVQEVASPPPAVVGRTADSGVASRRRLPSLQSPPSTVIGRSADDGAAEVAYLAGLVEL